MHFRLTWGLCALRLLGSFCCSPVGSVPRRHFPFPGTSVLQAVTQMPKLRSACVHLFVGDALMLTAPPHYVKTGLTYFATLNKYLEKLANCCFLQFLCSSFAFLRVSSLPTLNWSLALCQGCVLGAEGLMGWGGGVCEADGPAESQSCPAGCGTEACARSLCDPAHSGCPWQ